MEWLHAQFYGFPSDAMSSKRSNAGCFIKAQNSFSFHTMHNVVGPHACTRFWLQFWIDNSAVFSKHVFRPYSDYFVLQNIPNNLMVERVIWDCSIPWFLNWSLAALSPDLNNRSDGTDRPWAVIHKRRLWIHAIHLPIAEIPPHLNLCGLSSLITADWS
jgi:hypothetical protein